MENLDIRRKQYGLFMGQPEGPGSPGFSYDRVIDVWTANNLYFGYNQYGLWQQGWVSNVRIRNLFGYLNERSLLHADTQYDWLIDGVMSQADGAHGVAATDAPIYLSTRQDVTIRHVTVAAPTAWSSLAGATQPNAIPTVYFLVTRAHDNTGEWYRGHIKADTFTLFGTKGDAVYITGTGFVDLHNVHAGSTHCLDVSDTEVCGGGQSFYGGPGIIGGSCVNAAGPETDVYIDGGFCHSNLTDKTRWMHNVTRAANIRGYSPVGIVSTPFDPAGFIGPGGTQALPLSGKLYKVRGVEVLVSCDWPGTTSNDDGGRIELFDADGGLFFGTAKSGPLYPTLLPVGWMIRFSDFATPPRVRVGGS